MGRNPLDGGEGGGGSAGSGSGGGPMKPGDIRIMHARDPKTNEILKTFTLHRTTRDYVYDLCDAYNAERTRRDIEWYVTQAGELKLGEPSSFTAQHTQRLQRRAESERR